MMVYCAILNQGSIRQELSRVITHITHRNKHTLTLEYPAEKPISHNRNLIVKRFLDSGHDYLLMLDGDIIPPLNILDLVDKGVDIIGGLCFAYTGTSIVPLVFKENEWGKYNIMNVKGNEGMVECDAIGSGCMLIHRSVLEKVNSPFSNIYDDEGIKKLGLDLSFCKKAKELGFKVFCHLDFPCSHWTMMDLKEVYQTYQNLITQENK